MNRSPQIFITVVSCLLPLILPAQWSALTTSEQGRVNAVAVDSAKVDTLNEWAYITSMPKYATAALELAQKTGYRMGLSDAWVQLGSMAQDSFDYARAKRYFRLAMRERLELKNYNRAASCFNRLAIISRLEGNYDASIQWSQEGLLMLKEQPLHINKAFLYNALGTAARLGGKYDLAEQAFKDGIYTYQQLTAQEPDKEMERDYALGMTRLRLNMAAFLQESRFRYSQAKDSLLKSLRTFNTFEQYSDAGKCLLLLGNNAYYCRQLDSAMAYYEQGIQMRSHLEQTDFFLFLENRGRVLMEQRRYKLAYRDIESALHFFSTKQDSMNWADALFEMGNWFYEQNQLDSAILFYQKAVQFPNMAPLQRGRLLFFLSDALSQVGLQAEAKHYTDTYIAFLNSLNNVQSQGIFEMLNQHQLDKNRLLRRLEQADKAEMERVALMGGSMLLLLLLLALFWVRNQRQKRYLSESIARNAQSLATIAEQNAEKAEKEKEIALQNEQIAKQRETIVNREKLELIQQKEMETQYARLEAQDELQKQIGRELHDNVGAMLTAVKLNLFPVDEVLDRFPSEKRVQYSEANRILDEACQELRRISHELSAVILSQFGLKAQLEAFANILRNSGKYEVELDLHALEGRFDKKIEINIYRIVQELVSNIIKHAKADKISISANHFENMINIIVEDNGEGFDDTQALQKPGMGFMSLQARTHDMKGHMFIDTRIGRGTTISVDIPLFSVTDLDA